jgi:hypothetical protein
MFEWTSRIDHTGRACVEPVGDPLSRSGPLAFTVTILFKLPQCSYHTVTEPQGDSDFRRFESRLGPTWATLRLAAPPGRNIGPPPAGRHGSAPGLWIRFGPAVRVCDSDHRGGGPATQKQLEYSGPPGGPRRAACPPGRVRGRGHTTVSWRVSHGAESSIA